MNKDMIKLAFQLGYNQGLEDLEKQAQNYLKQTNPELYQSLRESGDFAEIRRLNSQLAAEEAAKVEKKFNLKAKAKSLVAPTNMGGGSMSQIEALNRLLLDERIRHGRATLRTKELTGRNATLTKDLEALTGRNATLTGRTKTLRGLAKGYKQLAKRNKYLALGGAGAAGLATALGIGGYAGQKRKNSELADQLAAMQSRGLLARILSKSARVRTRTNRLEKSALPWGKILKGVGMAVPIIAPSAYFGSLALRNWKDKIKAENQIKGHLDVLDRQRPTARIAGYGAP